MLILERYWTDIWSDAENNVREVLKEHGILDIKEVYKGLITTCLKIPLEAHTSIYWFKQPINPESKRRLRLLAGPYGKTYARVWLGFVGPEKLTEDK